MPCGESVPVGSSGVEQRPDPVVPEPPKLKGGPFHSLDEVVGRFGGSVGDVASVPGSDLSLPADQGASQGVNFRWVGLVLEVAAEALDEDFGEVGVGVGVDLADDSLACHAVLTSPLGSPAARRPSRRVRPLSVSRSSALVNRRRIRYRGSSLRPRWPRVSFWTRRRHSSSFRVRQVRSARSALSVLRRAGFSGAVSRTGRAPSNASGSPRARVFGQ